MPHGSAPSHRVPAFFEKRPAVQLRHSPVLKYVPRGQRTVGKAVGIKVGIDVGASDGWGDGSRVGPKDGINVGARVGAKVGARLGRLEGANVGARVGTDVGTRLGRLLGTAVGEHVVALQVAAPASHAYVSLGQAAQEVWPVRFWKVPGSQSKQVWRPVPLENRPLGHWLQEYE